MKNAAIATAGPATRNVSALLLAQATGRSGPDCVDNAVKGAAPGPPPAVPMDNRWRGILRGETPMAIMPRLGRRLFGIIPSPWRCKFCNAPFRGPYAGTFRRIGYSPSRKNPNICARCIESAPEGGAVVPISVLFADVRGYTSLTERTSSMEMTALLRRFYAAASRALLAHEAVLGQIAGDEVMASVCSRAGWSRVSVQGHRRCAFASTRRRLWNAGGQLARCRGRDMLRRGVRRQRRRRRIQRLHCSRRRDQYGCTAASAGEGRRGSALCDHVRCGSGCVY